MPAYSFVVSCFVPVSLVKKPYSITVIFAEITKLLNQQNSPPHTHFILGEKNVYVYYKMGSQEIF